MVIPVQMIPRISSDESKALIAAIRLLYTKISDTDSYRVKQLFELWLIEFRQNHGDLKGQRAIDKESLAKLFSVELSDDSGVLRLIFSLQTYYVLTIKIMALQALLYDKSLVDYYDMRNCLNIQQKLERGELFAQFNIFNFCRYDYYSWYLDSWGTGIEGLVSSLVKLLENQIIIENEDSVDHLKDFYEKLFPPEIRHPLGEFFTPKWLTEFTIKQLAELSIDQFNDLTFLDPTCGSGSFLIALINHIYLEDGSNKEKQSIDIDKIFDNIVGYELNYVSVIAAKVNYILILKKQLAHKSKSTELPVYYTDSLYLPELTQTGNYELEMLGYNFQVPQEVVEKRLIEEFFTYLLDYKKLHRTSSSNQIENIKKQQYLELHEILENNDECIDHNHGQLKEIKDAKLREFLVFVTINRFEPLFRKFDRIVGNPPWVGWEYIPDTYREKTKHLWMKYQLYNSKGIEAANLKEDISTLMIYAFVDRHLTDQGLLAFVIRSSLFKSPQTGREFRRFKFRDTLMKILRVDDFSSFNAFNDATNLTSVLYMEKGKPTSYPVVFNSWSRNGDRIADTDSIATALLKLDKQEQFATPMKDRQSRWLTASKELLQDLEKIKGKSAYRARIGVFTGGANAIYYVEMLDHIDNSRVLVKNYTKRAKRKVPSIEVELEKAMVKPILKGRDLKQWTFNHRLYLIFPHSEKTLMQPIPEEEMEQSYPLTLEYFNHFRETIEKRKGFSWDKDVKKQGYYSIQRIGPYTFKKYRVAWRYISKQFQCAVIQPIEIEGYSSKITPLPNDKLSYIGTDDEQEAYYICGLLTSSPYKYTMEKTMISTQISPSIISGLNIPKFNPDSEKHRRISTICKEAHQVKESSDKLELQEKLDIAVADMFDIDETSLQGFRNYTSEQSYF